MNKAHYSLHLHRFAGFNFDTNRDLLQREMYIACVVHVPCDILDIQLAKWCSIYKITHALQSLQRN